MELKPGNSWLQSSPLLPAGFRIQMRSTLWERSASWKPQETRPKYPESTWWLNTAWENDGFDVLIDLQSNEVCCCCFFSFRVMCMQPMSQTNGRDPSVMFNSHTVLCGMQGRIDHLDPHRRKWSPMEVIWLTPRHIDRLARWDSSWGLWPRLSDPLMPCAFHSAVLLMGYFSVQSCHLGYLKDLGKVYAIFP